MKIFILVLVNLISCASFASEVSLPALQEIVAIAFESKINESKNYGEYLSNYITQNQKEFDRPYLNWLKKEDVSKIKMPKVERNGRILKLKFENSPDLQIEIVDALNKQYAINGYQVNLLRYPTLLEKHKYLERVLRQSLGKEKKKSAALLFLFLAGTEARADFDILAFGSTAGTGTALAGACAFANVFCPGVVLVGVALGGVAYGYCTIFKTGICATTEGKIGSALYDMGIDVEKLISGKSAKIQFSCKKKIFRISEENTQLDLDKKIMASFEKCCSIDATLCENKFKESFDKRNQALKSGQNEVELSLEGGAQ